MVARQRLMTRLLDARRYRCIAITGPAGAGKTTLLASWRQELVTLGFDVAWLALSPEDNDIARFLDSLVAAVSEIDPALTRDAAILGAETDPDAAERLTIALVRAISTHPREVMLMIDDLRYVNAPDVHDALQWLLDHAPPNLHLTMASRGTTRLSLESLRSQDQILEIEPHDLRFSLEETGQFLAAQLGQPDPRIARRLHELSDGWAAGLQLFCLDWKKRKHPSEDAGQAPPFADGLLHNAETFARYFEREVLCNLSPQELKTLVLVSTCSRFCAALCASLTEHPHEVGKAVALLARLELDHLFLVPVDGPGSDAWYRLHPLLRETLLERFAALDSATRRQIHSRAWRWFGDKGLLDEAVRHAVQAGEHAQAAAMVEQCVQSLFIRGERRTIILLLRLLPAEQIDARPGLRLWMARTQLYLRELDACAQSLERLERDVPPDDEVMRFNLTLLRATLAVQRDDIDGALAILPDLLGTPATADAIAIGGRNNILSWLYTHQGEHELARRIQSEAPPLQVDGAPLLGTAAGSLQGRCLVGLSYAQEGRITQAGRIYRAVAAEARQCGKACAETYHLAIALLCEVLYELDDTQQARTLLQDNLDVMERVGLPDAVLRALRVLAAAHWQVGNRLESFACLDRLEDYAVRHGLDRLLGYALADQIQRHLLLGELMSAEDVMARLEVINARSTGIEHGATGEIREVAERSRIRLAVALGDLEDAARRLERLRAQCEARGRQRIIVQLLIGEAVIDDQRGRPQAAGGKVLEALQRGHRLGLMRSLLDAEPQAPRMIRKYAHTGEPDPVLAFYVERLDAARNRRPSPAPAGAHTPADAIETFSDREMDVFRLLAQTMPNKRIARALGVSPETVKWHLARIYSKLGVSGRDEALARARDLGWNLVPEGGTLR